MVGHPAAARGAKWPALPPALLAITMGYVLLALLYAVLTPIGEAPDELEHIRYVEYLVRFQALPPIGQGTAARPYTTEAKQPPAYYILNAGLMLALGRGGQQLAPDIGAEDPAVPPTGAWYPPPARYAHPPTPPTLIPWVYCMRLLSVLLGVGSVVLTFLTVREVFGDRDKQPLALGAAAMAAFLPQFTF